MQYLNKDYERQANEPNPETGESSIVPFYTPEEATSRLSYEIGGTSGGEYAANVFQDAIHMTGIGLLGVKAGIKAQEVAEGLEMTWADLKEAFTGEPDDLASHHYLTMPISESEFKMEYAGTKLKWRDGITRLHLESAKEDMDRADFNNMVRSVSKDRNFVAFAATIAANAVSPENWLGGEILAMRGLSKLAPVTAIKHPMAVKTVAAMIENGAINSLTDMAIVVHDIETGKMTWDDFWTNRGTIGLNDVLLDTATGVIFGGGIAAIQSISPKVRERVRNTVANSVMDRIIAMKDGDLLDFDAPMDPQVKRAMRGLAQGNDEAAALFKESLKPFADSGTYDKLDLVVLARKNKVDFDTKPVSDKDLSKAVLKGASEAMSEYGVPAKKANEFIKAEFKKFQQMAESQGVVGKTATVIKDWAEEVFGNTPEVVSAHKFKKKMEKIVRATAKAMEDC